MTFLNIWVKMFRENFNRYRVYLLCCFFATTLFFCFATIFTNRSFMEGQAVDPMISGNIIFPSFLAAFFLLSFVPCAYAVFFSARKQEYGILFSLGMSRLTAWKYLFMEGIVLGILALSFSFLVGTILSFFFYGMISHVIGIIELQWEIPYKAYAVTAWLYGIALGITVALQGAGLLGRQIRSLLLAPYQAEDKGKGIRWMKRCFPNYVGRHLLEYSLFARHKVDWAVRYGISVLLVGSALYLVSFCAVFQSSLLRDVENYCPYDFVYSEIHDGDRGAIRIALMRQ